MSNNYERDRDAAAAAIEVPADDEFLHEFIADPKLRELASVLIMHCAELSPGCEDFAVEYLWKRTGGKSRGSVTLGKCNKLSGLALYFAHADFAIWLAADHCRARIGINFAALMFHELMHVDRDENGAPATRGHELEVFSAEIERFGIWRDSMRPIAEAFRECVLPEDEHAELDRSVTSGAGAHKSGDRPGVAPPTA